MLTLQIHKPLVAALVLAVSCGAAVAQITQYATDFEDFALGHRDPQVNGLPIIDDPDPALNWTGDGLTGLGGQGDYDADIEDIGGAYGQVFRINNVASAQTGNYDWTHPATPALQSAGETGSGATLNRFEFSLEFKAAVDSYQENLYVQITPTRSGNTALRQGYIGVTDQPDGLMLSTWDYPNGAWRQTVLASGLSRSEWHSLSGSMTFIDGPGNDLLEYTLNGQTFTGTTWEDVLPDWGFTDHETIDCLMWRLPPADTSGGQNIPYDPSPARGNGLYFDNVYTAATPEPATMGLLTLAGAALLRRRR